MGARAVLVVTVALASPGHVWADELERCGAGGYLEPSAMLGASTRIVGPGLRATSASYLLGVGGGLSVRLCSPDRDAVTRLQLGLAFMLTSTGTTDYEGTGTLGFEAAADHTIAPDWRLGGVAGIGFGNERHLYSVGARLHYRDWGWVGLSVMRLQTGYTYDPCSHPSTTVQGCQSSATGVFAGVGSEHRYVGYATGALVVVGGIAIAIIAAGLGAVH